METKDTARELIDLLLFPGFLVKNQKITRVNDAARRLFLEEGMEVLPLLVTGKEEYSAFSEGCLCLTLTAAGESQGATVSRIGETDVFLLNEQEELKELQALALASKELRQPLFNVILSADRLQKLQNTAEGRESAARLSRGTAQLQRIICSMSDALRYAGSARLQIKNITALYGEFFEKARILAEKAGISLSYEGPREDIFSLADEEQLERAAYNLLSNALKFTPEGGTVSVKLTRKGKLLQLTMEDSGSGIADSIVSSIFTRYLRQPSLEDSRFGLGLGMVLVRCAARNHGGTVLVGRPGSGARISMTLSIRENQDPTLHSPVFAVDYAGERDHGLLELSESLPADLYLPE